MHIARRSGLRYKMKRDFIDMEDSLLVGNLLDHPLDYEIMVLPISTHSEHSLLQDR